MPLSLGLGGSTKLILYGRLAWGIALAVSYLAQEGEAYLLFMFYRITGGSEACS